MNTALLQVLQLALQHFLALLLQGSEHDFIQVLYIEFLRRSYQYCTYPHIIALIASTQLFLYNQQTVNLLHFLFRKIGHLC